MKLSRKFKANLKQATIKTALIASTAVVLLGASTNLDSILNGIIEKIASVEEKEIKAKRSCQRQDLFL